MNKGNKVKELIYFWGDHSEYSMSMLEVMEEIKAEHPEIHVSTVDVNNDEATAKYYFSKYHMVGVPATIGLIDGELIDGHYGIGSKFVIMSLVN